MPWDGSGWARPKEGITPVVMRQNHKDGAALAEYEAEDGSIQKAVQVTVDTARWDRHQEIEVMARGRDWPKPPKADAVMILTYIRSRRNWPNRTGL